MSILAHSAEPIGAYRRGSTFLSIVTLAIWRIRQTWGMLLLAGIGVLVAVTLTCAIPLYVQVSERVGFSRLWSASAQNAEVVVQSSTTNASSEFIHAEEQQVDTLARQDIGDYLAAPFQVTLQTRSMSVVKNDAPGDMTNPANYSGNVLSLTAYAMEQAGSHVTMQQGHLPHVNNNAIEIAVTAATAEHLHINVGSTIAIKLSFQTASAGDTNQGQALMEPLALQVVGIFSSSAQDVYWHGSSFESTQTGVFSALTDSDALLNGLARIADHYHVPTISLQDPLSLTWHYSLNEHIVSSDINSLIAKFSAFHAHIKQGLWVHQEQQNFSASGAAVPNDNDSPPTFPEQYQDLTNVAQISLLMLTLQVLGLSLFFLVMLVSVLVERQESAIALLLSRGASRRQIFGALLTQGLGLCILGLVLGPLLAVALVFGMGQWFFAGEDRPAFGFLQQNPFQVAWTLHWYALGASAVVLIALLVAFYRIVNGNILQLRRETTRSTHHPLWQRAYLDVIAALVALAGYVLALYVAREATGDARSAVLVVSPLTLVAPLFLLVAAILFALRLFPHILRGGAVLAGRGSGAVSMLALAQMSRTPRRVLGMILLLALATGFSFFSLVYTASQSQHIQDISDYQAGADFSGFLSIVQKPKRSKDTLTMEPMTSELYADYQRIQGENAVSLGYRTDDFTYPGVANPISLFAVDDQTFAKTAHWTQQNSTQALKALMDELDSADQQAMQQNAIIGKTNPTAIPALVDTLLWNSLHLQRGHIFILKEGETTFTFVAVDEVQHLSPLADSVESASMGGYAPPGGLLTDLDVYAHIVENEYKVEFIPRNYLWLDAQDNSSALSNVRVALAHGGLQLKSVSDRRALADELETDPIYLALKGTLLLDSLAALLLSLLGCLVLSWLSVSSRLTNFALLRALGTTAWQVASTLIWEQGVLYFTALVLGVLFGGLLIVTMLPSIIFTGVPNGGAGMETGAIYALQHLFPSPIILNASDCIPLGMLLVLCVAAVIMMVLVVSRLSTGQVLRLNED